MSHQETRRGRIKLVPNIPGETTYEKKAREMIRDLADTPDAYDTEDWQEAFLEWDYDFNKPGKYEILNDQIYEVLEDKDLSDDGGFCEMTPNPDGSISFIASWYNGGASLSEVLEDYLESNPID